MAIYVDKDRCPQSHPCPMIPACPVQAITQQRNGLPIIDNEKCIECGNCAEICHMRAVLSRD